MESNVSVIPAKQTPVMIRREMVKNPSVIRALGPVERAVFLASTAPTVAEYVPEQLVAELKTTLKWIAKDVGYRSADESDMQYLVIRTAEILKRYYSNFTLKDFKMAFEMSITGELDEYLPTGRDGKADRGHYQQFNAEYICKILNAYKARRGNVLKKAFEAVERPELKPGLPHKGYRPETKRDCIAAFLAYKETGELPVISPIAELLYYDILAGCGLADEIVITEDEQKTIWQRTVNEYARRGMVGDVNRLKQEGTGARELEHGIFALARRKALKRTFARMVEQEIQITDYIKFEE